MMATLSAPEAKFCTSSRATTSMYTTAIVKRFTCRLFKDQREEVEDRDEEEEEFTEHQEEVLESLQKTVYETLLEMDKRAYQHESHAGRTSQALIEAVCSQGTLCLNSYKGHHDSSPDLGLYSTIRQIQMGDARDDGYPESVYKQLEYRMTQMVTTDRYLEMMGLHKPKGQTCHEFCAYELEHSRSRDGHGKSMRMFFDREVLFPHPIPQQGWEFTKGAQYLLVAFEDAHLSQDGIVKKLDDLAARVDAYVTKLAEGVMQVPEVVLKRRELNRAFNFIPRL